MIAQVPPNALKPEDIAAKLARIAAEQGNAETSNVEHLSKLAETLDLWDSDEEFDEFLAGIARTRAEKG